ncbi:MAG: hypothetical protein KDD69_04420 [Bdellovibrionales bacterium]|nr:hypothetical protein [Bdellovibrionales bacterium]
MFVIQGAAAEHSPKLSREQAIQTVLNRFSIEESQILLDHPSHRARFSIDGFEYRPKNTDLFWKWKLTEVHGQGTHHSAVGDVRPMSCEEQSVCFFRDGLTERYVVKRKTIEQQFLVRTALPPGQDLEITGVVTSNGEFARSEHGLSWRRQGRSVQLGTLTVYDADGKLVPARFDVSSNRTSIRIAAEDLATARFPLLIDPEVGTNDARISQMGPDGNTMFGGDHAAIAYNSTNNEYLVVWTGDTAAAPLVDGEFEIFGQRIDAITGALVGSQGFRISDMGPNGDINYGAFNPSVTYNSVDNEYLVVWEGDDTAGGLVDEEFEIFGQRIDAATGAEVGTNDFRISDMGPDGNGNFDAFSPSVAFSSTSQEYLVVWHGDDNQAPLVDNEYEIFGQRIAAASGTEVGSNDFRLSDMGTDGTFNGDARYARVAFNTTLNEYLVVWQGEDNIAPLVIGESEIFGQRLSAVSGAELGSNDFRISDMGPDGDTAYAANRPDVAYNSAQQEFLVVWYGDDNTGAVVDDETDIYGQRIDATNGSEVGTNDLRIGMMGPDGSTEYPAQNPRVVYNSAESEYLVVWTGSTVLGALVPAEFEIFGQRVAGATGALIGTSPLRISDMGPDGTFIYGAFSPALSYSAAQAEYFVTWYGDDNTPPLVDEEIEIFGQRLELNSAPGAPTLALSSSSDSGTSSSDRITNDSTPTFTGTSEPGSTVALTSSLDGSLGIVTATAGTYSFTTPELSAGTHAITAIATDSDGNDGPSSAAVSVTIDLSVAAPALSSPSSGVITSDLTPRFQGTSEANAVVTIVLNGADAFTINANSSGAFSADPPTELPPSPYTVSAIARDPAGNSSIPSSPISFEINRDDTDGDGILDPDDSDDDNDGVSDAQEITEGSDPKDASSYLYRLGPLFSSDWNSHLGMLNIAEFVNTAEDDNPFVISNLYSSTGLKFDDIFFEIPPGGEVDLLVHGLDGFGVNNYGTLVSFSFPSSAPVDGRMVHYRPDENFDMQFAFAMPFSLGLAGSVFVPFNTFQPSLAPGDETNVVANWISIDALLTARSTTGTLLFYDSEGIELGRFRFDANDRVDISGHQFGENRVGLVEWRPDEFSNEFTARNIRYYYDNPTGADSFDSAFQLEAVRGSKQTLTVPLDTRSSSSIIEVANTGTEATVATITLFNRQGEVITTVDRALAPYASTHFITDTFLVNDLGSASIKAAANGKIIAVVMQYGRSDTAAINYIYGIHGREALGTTIRGSYNTFIGQKCALLLLNPTDTQVTAAVRLVRYDGTVVREFYQLAVPARGIVEDTICDYDIADAFGVVTVAPSQRNTLVGYVIRYGKNNSYRFPTLLR